MERICRKLIRKDSGLSTEGLLLKLWGPKGFCYVILLGATRWSIRTRDLTSSERSSKEAKGAGPMRFWRRLLDDTLVVAVTPGTDMMGRGCYWVGGMSTGKQDTSRGQTTSSKGNSGPSSVCCGRVFEVEFTRNIR